MDCNTVKTERQLSLLKLQEFIDHNYIFRFNTLLQATEVKRADSDYDRHALLDKRLMASIVNDAILEGIHTSQSEVKRVLESLFVRDYNPIEDFLDNLPSWDGSDRITQLAQRVNTTNTLWQRFFHKWFVAMVATWQGTDTMHTNSLVPVIVGPQGAYKSTFCRSILPSQLRYLFAESFNVDDQASVARCMGRFALINIDEFDQLNARKQAMLKNIIQTPVGNVRRLYSNTITEVRRYASFIATSNQHDLLTDPTGSRRFICVETEGEIDVATPIDHAQLYAQAKAEIALGTEHYLTKEDERLLEESNTTFKYVSPLTQLFLRYYRIPASDALTATWVSPLDMVTRMMSLSSIHLNLAQTALLGRELRALGIRSRRMGKGMEYWVEEK